MPSDAVHVKWGYRAAFAGGAILYVRGVDLIDIILMACIFMFGIKCVSPDLDDKQSLPYNRWGIIKWMFFPIAKYIKHRTWTHHIIIGPILLVSYVILVLVLIGTCLNLFWLPVVEPLIDRVQEMLSQIISLNISHENTMIILPTIACLLAAVVHHILIDKIFTGDRQA